MTVGELRKAIADKPDELHVCIVTNLRSSKPPELIDPRRLVLVRELEGGRHQIRHEIVSAGYVGADECVTTTRQLV